ncbi:Solute carrier family protein [Spironucleus salmonicida]|uniref:EamA-like transporter family protein n=1 Tax=Spironucleus salmonicida TaxID=348837 RepID=V6LCT0_9EUKA|nr:Solute carrier family protein [Spironucleus salmonicida]|eukprot:EST42290.1 EamA-like transporter family protein [Spironucleus salmonicida]
MKLSKIVIITILTLSVSLLNALLVNLINASYIYGEYAPFFCNYIYYFCCILMLLHPKNWNWTKLWTRLVCGLVDALGGILITYSYKFTAPASATLLLSVSTPFSMLFSFLLNKYRYSVLEVILLVLTVGFAAGFAGSDFSGTNWLGSVLACLSGVTYGFGTAINERFSAGVTIAQFLSQIGISGFALNFAASLAVEMPLYRLFGWQIVLIQVAWGVGLFAWYWLAVALIQRAGGVVLSLALLGSNVFTFPLAILIFGRKFVWWQVLLGAGLIASVAAFVFVNDRRNRRAGERGENVYNIQRGENDENTENTENAKNIQNAESRGESGVDSGVAGTPLQVGASEV